MFTMNYAWQADYFSCEKKNNQYFDAKQNRFLSYNLHTEETGILTNIYVTKNFTRLYKEAGK